MKIAIYHPNLDLFGGGETVALTIASILSRRHKVDIFTSQEVNKNTLEKFFGLNLTKVNIVLLGKGLSNILIFKSARTSLILRNSYEKLENYDLVIDTCTNGWFDKKLKTKTICYIHYPFFYRKKKGIKRFMNKLIIQPQNAFQYDKIFCNSNYTKNIVSELTNKKLEVLYPPVEVKKIKPEKKLNRIVTIGRFTYDKKHEIMIEAFKDLCNRVDNYTLHIIGSFQGNVGIYKKEYLNMLIKKAKGYPIYFHINIPHDKVLKFLEESKIYWHARGYGETDPNEYENFGIATVEAMAAGCIPVVINLGAQPEIVNHGKNGYCWNTNKELVNITKKIVVGSKDKDIIERAIESSKKYSTINFLRKFNLCVNKLIINKK